MLIGVSLIRSIQRDKNNHAPLFNVGSCGLHSIHGPLRDRHDLKPVGNRQNFENDV